MHLVARFLVVGDDSGDLERARLGAGVCVGARIRLRVRVFGGVAGGGKALGVGVGISDRVS